MSETDDRARRRATIPVGVGEARSRFGGLDVPASVCGMLVAIALVLILGGIAVAITATLGSTTVLDRNGVFVSSSSIAATGAVLMLSFLAGGWAAGRMARYSGMLNGALVVVWFLVLGAGLTFTAHVAAVGSNLFSGLDVAQPQVANWFTSEPLTGSSIIAIVVSVCVMFTAAVLGGAWGQRMHRRADELISSMPDDVALRAPTDQRSRLAS